MAIYVNELKKAAMDNYGQIICGAELVEIYKNVAKANGKNISLKHVPLNVHKWAKKNGRLICKMKNNNGKWTSIYIFNF